MQYTGIYNLVMIVMFKRAQLGNTVLCAVVRKMLLHLLFHMYMQPNKKNIKQVQNGKTIFFWPRVDADRQFQKYSDNVAQALTSKTLQLI